MGVPRLETEFGYYISWMADAIEDLHLQDPIPAACRGTGDLALLEHLGSLLVPAPGSAVLDVGCGMGGPAAWLMRRFECRVVAVDVMHECARAARRLFPDIAVSTCHCSALPFPPQSFDALWALGALEMVGRKRQALGAMYRVVRPGGRAVVYDFVWGRASSLEQPQADRFETVAALEEHMVAAGWGIERSEPSRQPYPTGAWKEQVEMVRDRVHREHVGRTLDEVERQLSLFSALRRDLAIVPWEFVLTRAR